MTVFTEGRHAAEFILSEAPGQISRDNAVIAVSQTLEAGRVLGRKAVVADVVASAAAVAGNTGDATIAMADPAVSSKVKDGVYRGVCQSATTVRWEDPNGKEIGLSTHGAAFNKEIKLTITAGATPNVAGDAFEVTVKADAEDFQYGAFNQDATDGLEVPAAIAIYPVTTSASATAKTAILARMAEVNANLITWPSDIDAAELADAKQALADLGILVR